MRFSNKKAACHSCAMSSPTTIAKGLEGVVIDTSNICLIDGQAGRLIFRGYDIHDLAAHTTYEEVAYLLWRGDLPSKSQLDELKSQFSDARSIPESMISLMQNLSRDSSTLDVLRTIVSALGVVSPSEKPDISQAIALTAKIPTIVTAFERLRQGLKPVPPLPDLGHAANYLYMLTGQVPQDANVNAMDTYLVCLADHGLNASTFTARIVASTWSDIYSAVTAAIGALKGPIHGGAPGPVLEMLQEIGRPERSLDWMSAQLSQGNRLMGFGHRIYRTMDPRAVILRDLASKIADRDLFQLAQEVEKTGLELLRKKNPDHANTNVEFYSCVVMHSIGLPIHMFTPSFACSRTAGWTAHVIEQVANNRLIRPRTEYSGPRDKMVLPIQKR
jgi:citrate synthase